MPWWYIAAWVHDANSEEEVEHGDSLQRGGTCDHRGVDEDSVDGRRTWLVDDDGGDSVAWVPEVVLTCCNTRHRVSSCSRVERAIPSCWIRFGMIPQQRG